MHRKTTISATEPREADETQMLVQAVEREFWAIHARQGKGAISWPEAELYLLRILGHNVGDGHNIGDPAEPPEGPHWFAVQPQASRDGPSWGKLSHRHQRNARA